MTREHVVTRFRFAEGMMAPPTAGASEGCSGTGVMVVVSAVVVVGLAIVNSAGPPATAPASFGVNLGGPAQLGTENAHLARIGARCASCPC